MVEQALPTTVPVVKSLSEIYLDVDGSLKNTHEARYINMIQRFEGIYGQKPRFFVRAPGRVNIIGEHIDYCGYSVLPAAVEQDFVMAYAPSDDDKITINNIDKDLYATEVISTDPFQKFKSDAHWLNYFLCGYKSVLALDSPVKSLVSKPVGLNILIWSLVPAAAGLSSSSAFCVCTAITTLHANGLIDKVD
jgi:galactokinase